MADAGLSDADVAAMNKGWFETMTAVRDKLRAVGKVRGAYLNLCGLWLAACISAYVSAAGACASDVACACYLLPGLCLCPARLLTD